MAPPIPTLGFNSRQEAIAALLREGLDTRQIAARLGVPVTSIGPSVSLVRRKLGRLLRLQAGRLPQASQQINLMIDAGTLDGLRNEARRRRISTGALVRALLDTIVADGIYDAVLDEPDATVRGKVTGARHDA